jgi:NAD(P)H-hydrate epimerase
MSHVLSSAQMKAVDNRAITELGLPARLLMENAGKGCADYLLQHYLANLSGKVLILHGDGNNSGDGFVIARYLFLAGINVALVKVHNGVMSAETQANLDICTKLGIQQFIATDSKDGNWLKGHVMSSSVIIDAIFGIGFRGQLSSELQDLFSFIQRSPAKKFSLDIPSGVSADTGFGDDAFKADVTFCIHTPKLGSLIHAGKFKSGQLQTIPIGIPQSFNEAENAATHIDKLCHQYPQRYYAAHKGIYGRVMIMGGSPGYLGSVNMAAKAALRSGAGFVNLLSRIEFQDYYCTNPAEIMFIAIPEDEETLLPDREILLMLLAKANSIVIGPGLGVDKFALNLLEIVLKNSRIPTIVDADALRLIAENASLTKHLKKPNILLTPHYGEFCALAKTDVPTLLNDVLGALSGYIQKTKAKVLLKSDITIYQDNQNTYINTSGNDGLATGGSGDVLSGIIGSFAAQGMELGKAAINASYLLGKTAEYVATKRGTPSIIPSDIIDNLFIKEE